MTRKSKRTEWVQHAVKGRVGKGWPRLSTQRTAESGPFLSMPFWGLRVGFLRALALPPPFPLNQ